MNSHRGLAVSLVGFLLCALGAVAGVRAAVKPNIVLIMSDDAGFNSFGFSTFPGKTPRSETPNLDALATQSVVVKQGYAADSVCGTSRAGLLTGTYAQRFGFEDNIMGGLNVISTAGNQGLSDQQLTIAQHLKPLGYSTGAIGKWHLGYADGYNRPQDKGFDEFFGFLGGARQYFASGGDESSMRRGDTNIESPGLNPNGETWRNQGDSSKYDPALGRYTTDAFGEEAVSFINNHADDENPFFLYLAFNAPHGPWGAKQADLDHFASISDITRRTEAAINYAMDRSIGEVLTSLQTNGIDDNTIVVFMNDNGPASPNWNEGNSDPLRGYKGASTEGGIRVPMLVKAPGLTPGVYDHPLAAHDWAPTFYAAAGGDVSQIDVDGRDMMSYLKGEATEDPTVARFWRSFDTWAVRKGDWKLTLPYRPGAPGKFLFNITTNPVENIYYDLIHPEIVADLTRELTYWEAGLEKPKWGSLGAQTQNNFDHFVFRNNFAATTNWSTGGAWLQAGTANIKTVQSTDAYANGIFEFGVRNDADYTAQNDMKRVSRETFMLNQIRLTGEFQGPDHRQGNITGNALLFVKSLTGQLPQIRLDATSSGTPNNFSFQLNNEMQLLHDLEITGNGTQEFVINGRIRDYYEPQQPLVTFPHNVRKLGSSAVTLKGDNTFAGSFTVEQGSVTVSGPTAAINGAEGIDIRSAGSVTLQSGTIAVDWIKNAAGGSFNFNGGLLKVIDVTGDLVNNGGVYSPGASPARSSVSGKLTQNVGTFLIELGGFSNGLADSVAVGGTATIGSTLDIDLLNGFVPGRGQTFQFLTAEGGISGMFANTLLPTLPAGLTWNLIYNSNIAALVIGGAGGLGGHLPGDYNSDGLVDSADFTVWRNAMPTGNLAADGNSDGVINAADYHIWKSAFGLYFNGGSGGFAVEGVPEPAALCLSLFGGIIGLITYRKR